MDKPKILWADDEIDLLKPHILFLESKGYEIISVNNGNDAIEIFKKQGIDIVFLDENMPGLSGIETLLQLKNFNNDIPVVMITKSEEESIMEDAIGSKIADYLIKPVNPNQILLALKKNLENKRLINEKTNTQYQQEFRQIGMMLGDRMGHKEWVELYKKLIYWELQLDKSRDESMYEILIQQKEEANRLFSKFVENNYTDWLKNPEQNAPLQSQNVMKRKVFPLAESTELPVFFILIDNLRLDQWKIIQPIITELFRIVEEETYFAILPTATQYARNSIFAGLTPSDIEKQYPKLWTYDDDEGGKNLHEEEFLNGQIQRLRKNIKTSYTKITNLDAGKLMVENIPNLFNNKLNVIVYNFVDMLSHARTEMDVIRELAEDAVNGVPGIRNITSVSREGKSNITVEFELGVGIEAAANDVRDKVSGA